MTANYSARYSGRFLKGFYGYAEGVNVAKIMNMSAQAMAAHPASEMQNSQVSRVMIL